MDNVSKAQCFSIKLAEPNFTQSNLAILIYIRLALGKN